MVMWFSSEENLPDWLIEGLIPAYFTIEEALRKRRTSPISDTICAPSACPMPGMVRMSGSTSSMPARILASTSDTWPSMKSIWPMSSLIWKEKADVARPMPHEALAMPFISSAFARPSLPWLARGSWPKSLP